MKNLAAFLRQTMDDGRLSRSETSALREVLEDYDVNDRTRAEIRRMIFEISSEGLASGRAAADVLIWTEAALKLLEGAEDQPVSVSAEALFTPGEECLRRIITLIDAARRSVDVCVFTITDDRIAAALRDSRRRGVGVRIITDDEKAMDLGSDIEFFVEQGIDVAVDTEGHMHHKFAIVDGARLLSGSYNWTRGAAAINHENLVITDDRRLLRAFAAEFERLWTKFHVNRLPRSGS